jgi:hypothetical protein
VGGAGAVGALRLCVGGYDETQWRVVEDSGAGG